MTHISVCMCVCVPSYGNRHWESSVPGMVLFRHLRPSILWSACEVGDILEQRSCYNLVPTISRTSLFRDITYSVSGKSKISAFLLKKELCF